MAGPGGFPGLGAPTPTPAGKKPEPWSLQLHAGGAAHLIPVYGNSKINLQAPLGKAGLLKQEADELNTYNTQRANHIASILTHRPDLSLNPAPPAPVAGAVLTAAQQLKNIEDVEEKAALAEQKANLDLAQRNLQYALDMLQPASGGRCPVDFESKQLALVRESHSKSLDAFASSEIARINAKYQFGRPGVPQSAYVTQLMAAPLSLSVNDITKLHTDEIEKAKKLAEKLKANADKAFNDLLTNEHEKQKLLILQAVRLRHLLNNQEDWEGPRAAARLIATNQPLEQQVEQMWEIVEKQVQFQFPKWGGLTKGNIKIVKGEIKEGIHRSDITEETAPLIIQLLLVKKMRENPDRTKHNSINLAVEKNWRGVYDQATLKAAMLLAAHAIAMGCEVTHDCDDDAFKDFIEEQKEIAVADKKALEKIEAQDMKRDQKQHAQKEHFRHTLAVSCHKLEDKAKEIEDKIKEIKAAERHRPYPGDAAMRRLLQQLKDLYIEFSKETVSVRTHIEHIRRNYAANPFIRKGAFQVLLEFDERALACQTSAHNSVVDIHGYITAPPAGLPTPRTPLPAGAFWGNFDADFTDFDNYFVQSQAALQAQEANINRAIATSRL